MQKDCKGVTPGHVVPRRSCQADHKHSAQLWLTHTLSMDMTLPFERFDVLWKSLLTAVSL